MRNTVFVISHVGADAETFVSILNENSRIKIEKRNIVYKHPEDLQNLWETKHKNASSLAVYGDLILYNQQFLCKKIYNLAKFIYLVREPAGTLGNISMATPELYYRFRLRRMCEMAKETPNALLITHQDLVLGKDLGLRNFLNLREEITYEFKPSENSVKVDKSCEECYERYLYYLKEYIK